MPHSLLSIPELRGLSSPSSLLRIPDQVDVPVTDRIKKIIDCEQFQRLRHVSQLGLVGLIYPGATHHRFEHSLGVYRNALLFVQQLSSDPRFGELVTPDDVICLILAALLHDIGHYPFCHPIEDLGLPHFQPHENLARKYLLSPGSEIGQLIDSEFDVRPEDVVDIIEGRRDTPRLQVLTSVLSGPIDVDKMDYLYRDSLHTGVPYGRNFDAPRLIGSLCLNEDGSRLAITNKGRTAAELLVFARYVMFSEVYWHHAVRSATAMLQRAVFELLDSTGDPNDDRIFETMYGLDDRLFGRELMQRFPDGSPQQELLKGIFGPRRSLYKRTANFSCMEEEDVYRAIARRPYSWLVECAGILASELENRLRIPIAPCEILVDAPPVGLEVQFDVDVYYPAQDVYRPLGTVSPVVHTLAKQQFDDLVKQVRVFATPRVADAVIESQIDLAPLLLEIAG